MSPAPRFLSVEGTPTFIMNFNAGSADGKYESVSAVATPSSSLQVDDRGIAVLHLRGSKHVSGSQFESVSVYRAVFNDCKAAQ